MHLWAYFRLRTRIVRRLIAIGAGLATTAAVLPALVAAGPGAASAASVAVDQVTVSHDNRRTSWDPGEPGMSPTAVQGFVQLFQQPVSGQVYAQPIVANNTLIVATEKDWVYGLDPSSGDIRWSKHLGTPYQITNCADLTPDVGITATPVYYARTGIVYVLAQVMSSGHPAYRLIGLDTNNNGNVVFSRGISGSPINNRSITFNATTQLARPGLLQMSGSVYAAFGSHCDHNPYVGYVARINLSTKSLVLWSTEAGSTGKQGAVWQSGGGVMSDGPGRIFVATGNGISPPAGTAGVPSELAESVIRLSTANNTLSAKDFFSPDNAPALDAADTDWGSGGPLALPAGTQNYPHVLVQIGKDGRVFLLNRDNLGHRDATDNNTALSVTSAYHGLWGHPAVFFASTTTPLSTASTGDYLYFIGKNDSLRALQFGVDSADKPTLTLAGSSSLSFGYSSGSPEVTSNGTDISSAVVWAVYSSGANGAGGMLTAYAAQPAPGGVLTQLNTWPLGTAAKFSNVATANGRVYVGSQNGADGYVYGFGAATPPVTVTPASFWTAPVSSASTRTVTVTAHTTVTVTGVTASTSTAGTSTGATPVPQFSVNASRVTETASGSSKATPVTFPVTLDPGDQLHAPVTFAPVTPGGINGTVSFATSSARFPSADVSLAADGTTRGLYAYPAAMSFALVNDVGVPVSDVPVGISVPRSFNLVNGSTRPVTVSSVQPPAGPYTAHGLPAPGTVLRPGQSVPVQVFFTPRTPGSYPSSLSVSAGGTTATVQLSGTGLPATGLFKASPAAINFGDVPVGKQVTTTVTITNSGNEPATVSASTVLNGPFRNSPNVPRQLPINAGYEVQVPVTFRPTAKGSFATAYKLTWTDVTGRHTVTVPVTGTGS